MCKKLIFLILVVFCFPCFGIGRANHLGDSSSVSEAQKRKAIPIPADRIVPPFQPLITGGDHSCVIKYDSGSVAYYFPDTAVGNGYAVYMDPQICDLNSYPFKITEVQFYLFGYSGGLTVVWPVEIRVNIRNLKKDTLYAVCDSPGTLLYRQTFTIPIDSSYNRLGRPMNLSLDSLNTPSSACRVDSSFFLEIIFTGGTNAPFPSLFFTDTTDRPDTCHDWHLFSHNYYEWHEAWLPPTPGKVVIRATGYSHSIDCYPCWYWKSTTATAPGGMPDLDQYQFNESSAMDVPTAVANCLRWFTAVPKDTTPPGLIRLLSTYFGTDPDSGTSVDSLQIGLGRYLRDYGFDLDEHTYSQPDFYEMAGSLESSQNIILILGFWQFDGQFWHRFGGHAVSLAGVCKESLWVAFSDPAVDGAELGWQGRFFPLWHPPHPDDDTLHNDSLYVSHDIYVSDSQDDTLWMIKDFYHADTGLFRRFEGQNFQPGQEQYRAPFVPQESVYTAVDYAITIAPRLPNTLWYWKPDRPAQDPPAESGMPDFDQYQFGASDSFALCAPTAIANCLWWFGEVPPDTNPPDLIRLLSDYFYSDPDSGTYVESIKTGLDSLFGQYSFNLYQSVFEKPDFFEMKDSLKRSQDIVLLLGFWQYDTTSQVWYRFGGHFVTMAGVCSESSKVAFSDPARDNAESGGKGRVRPSWHPLHPEDPTYHNNPINVSHDVYKSGILYTTHADTVDTTVDTLWWIGDYYLEGDTSWFSKFEGLNSQPGQEQYFHLYELSESVYTVVEYAIMICPKTTEVEQEEEGSITPKDFELYQSYPNPFNNQTLIKYDLLKPCPVSLTIYNILGQKVKTLVNQHQEAGSKIVSWDGKDEKGKDLSSGIYFYQLSTTSIGRIGEITQTKRMILLK